MNMLNEYRKNKDLINSYLHGEKIEGFDKNSSVIMGLSISLFILVLLLVIIIQIWALVLLVRYWNVIPLISKVLGVLGLFGVGGPLLTIIVVYVGIGSKKGKRKRR